MVTKNDALYNLLINNNYKNKHAYIDIRNNKIYKYTYNEFFEDIESCAKFFLSRGYNNERIILYSRLSYEWMVCFIGIILSGNVVVVLNEQITGMELELELNINKANILIFNEKRKKEIEIINKKETYLFIPINCKNERKSSWKIIGEKIEEPKKDPDSNRLCMIISSSGTTGKPKRVMLSQKNLIATIIGGARYIYIDKNDLILSILPIHHMYELTCGNLMILYFGATICINDELSNIMININKFRPSVMFVVPKILKFLEGRVASSKKMGLKPKTILGGKINKFIVGGAFIEESMLDKIRVMGVNVIQGYGITECSPLISTNGDKFTRRGSVGKAIPCCEIAIVNDEICVKGDNVMMGYLEGTEEIQEGWFKTGDLGAIDEDGFLYIYGRKKRLIVLENGEKVCPEELESIIQEIPEVEEVVVYRKSIKGRNLIVAEIYPSYDSISYICDIKNTIRKKIYNINMNLLKYKRINDVIIRTSPFEKTSTNKIKLSN